MTALWIPSTALYVRSGVPVANERAAPRTTHPRRRAATARGARARYVYTILRTISEYLFSR